MQILILKFFNFFLSKFGLKISRKMVALDESLTSELMGPDSTRISNLELVAREINQNKIVGQVAELGVYQGKFAKYINSFFPTKTLYLFDTFSGFDQKDIVTEKEKKFSEGSQDFSKTSVELVLSQMQIPSNCIIRKGFFPETTNGLPDNLSFAFVSIDTDLYEPIYNGLSYFYPRLSKGGYIFIHDFNNYEYPGAKKAVLKYCSENKIPYFPLSDGWGSVIIMK